MRWISTFLVSARKVPKETEIGGGFLQRRPLLFTSPPNPEDKFASRKAEMFRFPPCRISNFRTLSGEAAGGYIRGAHFSLAPPYADFFGYFLVRRQESNTHVFLAETRKGH